MEISEPKKFHGLERLINLQYGFIQIDRNGLASVINLVLIAVNGATETYIKYKSCTTSQYFKMKMNHQK